MSGPICAMLKNRSVPGPAKKSSSSVATEFVLLEGDGFGTARCAVVVAVLRFDAAAGLDEA